MTRGAYSGGYTPVDTLHSSSLLQMSRQNTSTNNNGGGGNYNSNYEYYDNTTATSAAHLLASGEGLYSSGGKSMKSRQYQASASLTKKTPNNLSYDAYNYELQTREDEYEEEIEKVEDDEADYDENYQEEEEEVETESMSSSRSEKNTNSTSESNHGVEIETTQKQPAIKPPPISTSANAAAIFNNNVSGSIGSGVESIKKHTHTLTSGKFRKQ